MTPSRMPTSVEFNHRTDKDVTSGGHRMDGDKNRIVDDRMLRDLISAYTRVEEDMDTLIRAASRLETVSGRAVDLFTELSDDQDAVLGINRDLMEVRRCFASGLIDLMVDVECIEDIVDERVDFEIGGFGDDEDDDSIPSSIDIPKAPLPPESGDETDPEYMSMQIGFLIECLKVVTTTHLGYARILNGIAGRVGDLEDAVFGDEDDGGED